MKTSHPILLIAYVFLIRSSHAETIEDAISYLKEHGGSDCVVIPTLTAHFEGAVEAISIGTYNGKGSTTYPELDAPKLIGEVVNGMITVDGIKFGSGGFATDTTYPPNGGAFTRYVGVSEHLIICIHFGEEIEHGYSIDFFSKGQLQPHRYNVRFPLNKKENKSEKATPRKPSD